MALGSFRDIDFWLAVKNRLVNWSSPLVLWLSLINVVALLYRIGFFPSASTLEKLHTFYHISAFLIFLILLIKALLTLINSDRAYWRRLTEFITPIILGFILAARFIYLSNPGIAWPWIELMAQDMALNFLFILIFLIEISKTSLGFLEAKLHPAIIFVLSFLVIILIGTGLLLLPKASTNGISLIDALFTSASAVCVTGLIVVDTARDFTHLGQVFILILIQIGGLGIMTFTSFFGFFFKGNTSLQTQLFFKDLVDQDQLGAIFKTLIRIVLFTLSLELLGAGIIYLLSPVGAFGDSWEQVWFSVFHSVSAFCNAGFSTLSNGLYEASVREAYNLHLWMGFMIIIGGLGFPIIFNYAHLLKSIFLRFIRKFKSHARYVHIPRIININTKIVMSTTLFLIISGMVFYWIAEGSNTLEGKSIYGKLVSTFFAAVTPRTAGFNTVDLSHLAMPTILIYLLLMWIGASPASTGGGIKTSTFGVAVLNIISLAKGKDRVEIFRRELDTESLRRASAIILLSFLIIGFSIFLVAILDPELSLIAIIFECFSAYGTVGLSLGITSELSAASKMVIILTMFTGRVGTLTIIVALVRKIHNLNYRYPRERIFIN